MRPKIKQTKWSKDPTSNYPMPTMAITLPYQYRPQIYRGKCDPRNIIGVVLGKTPENTYKIGVKTGILKGTYMRNAFAVCPRKHIAPDDVPTKSVSIREATKMLPRPQGWPGIFHCDCKQSSLQCSSRRWKCKKKQNLQQPLS